MFIFFKLGQKAINYMGIELSHSSIFCFFVSLYRGIAPLADVYFQNRVIFTEDYWQKITIFHQKMLVLPCISDVLFKKCPIFSCYFWSKYPFFILSDMYISDIQKIEKTQFFVSSSPRKMTIFWLFDTEINCKIRGHFIKKVTHMGGGEKKSTPWPPP